MVFLFCLGVEEVSESAPEPWQALLLGLTGIDVLHRSRYGGTMGIRSFPPEGRREVPAKWIDRRSLLPSSMIFSLDRPENSIANNTCFSVYLSCSIEHAGIGNTLIATLWGGIRSEIVAIGIAANHSDQQKHSIPIDTEAAQLNRFFLKPAHQRKLIGLCRQLHEGFRCLKISSWQK